MPNLLISGPAGAGKTAEARRVLEAATGPMVAADFQTLLSCLDLAGAATGRPLPRHVGSLKPPGFCHLPST